MQPTAHLCAGGTNRAYSAAGVPITAERRMRLPLQLGAGLPAVRLGRQLAGAGAPQHGATAGAGAPGAYPQAQGRLLHTPRQRHGRAEDATGAGTGRAQRTQREPACMTGGHRRLRLRWMVILAACSGSRMAVLHACAA